MQRTSARRRRWPAESSADPSPSGRSRSQVETDLGHGARDRRVVDARVAHLDDLAHAGARQRRILGQPGDLAPPRRRDRWTARSTPSTSTVPLWGPRSPQSTRSSVDLPDPDGPTTLTRPPAGMRALIGSPGRGKSRASASGPVHAARATAATSGARRTPPRPGRSSWASRSVAAAMPSAEAWNCAADRRSGRNTSGVSSSTASATESAERAVEEAQSEHQRDESGRERGQQLEREAREERHAQRPHRRALRSASPTSSRFSTASLRAVERLQHRHAAHDVAEVPGELLLLAPALLHLLLRLETEQDHEDRQQRDAHEHDERRSTDRAARAIPSSTTGARAASTSDGTYFAM